MALSQMNLIPVSLHRAWTGTMKQNRFEFIDIARGISIICIILGHLGNPTINRFVFTFHVPIFFLITGYFINSRKSVSQFIRHRFKTLIIPYIITCVAIILLALIRNQLFNDGVDNDLVLKKWIIASLYGAGDAYTKPFTIYCIGAIWFLLATFWASIILRLLLEVNAGVRMAAVACWFSVCCLSRRLFWLPWSIQASGPALLYMYIGHLVSDLTSDFAGIKIKKEIQYVAIILCFWVWIEFIIQFQSFWLVHCDYGRGVVDIVGSLCACSCILMVSYWMSKHMRYISKAFSYLGYYSLFMLCIHIIELDVFPWDTIIHIVLPGLSGAGLIGMTIAGKLVWSVGMTLICMRINFIRKLFGYDVIKTG